MEIYWCIISVDNWVIQGTYDEREDHLMGVLLGS